MECESVCSEFCGVSLTGCWDCGRCALRGTKHSFALFRSRVSLALCLVRAAFVTGRHSAAQHSVLCPCENIASSFCFLSILGVLRLVSDSFTLVRLWNNIGRYY